MVKVVYNRCYGGFGLSKEALKFMGVKDSYGIKRDDSKLVECVEKLGERANTRYSALRITIVPDGACWTIDEYDGMESVCVETKEMWLKHGKEMGWI